MDGKILIMDYSSYERQKVKHILEKIGNFEIIEISNLNQFKLFNIESCLQQLIIIDIAFPTEAEGFEVLKIFRSSILTNNTPIITITRTDMPEHKAKALQYSVNDFIIKPYQVKRLEDSIRSLITLNSNFHYDTGLLGNITMSFDDYISREMKYSKRIQSPLSFIFITTLKIKKNKDGIEQIEIRKFQVLMKNAFKKVSDKEMLEKTVLIPANTRNYADKSYNRYRKWF